MSRIAGSEAELAIRNFRARSVPWLSTVAGMLVALLPIVAEMPLLPDFGFLMLIAWRLLRPEIWTAPMALVLGLISDLISGHPLGQGMLLWTAFFLTVDLIDSRLGFRDYWMDWLIAAGALIFQTVGAWYIALLMHSDVRFAVMLPQLGLSVLGYPIVARSVVGIDRWRLMR
jgi:rod shape-determining protein MreD